MHLPGKTPKNFKDSALPVSLLCICNFDDESRILSVFLCLWIENIWSFLCLRTIC